MEITKESLYEFIKGEREHQDKKWGPQQHSDETWAIIAGEEFGEICNAILCNDEVEMLLEIVQVMAVLEAWVTSKDWKEMINVRTD